MTDETKIVTVQRKSLIGNPVCVGVGGFGITTVCLGLYSIHILPDAGMTVVLILAASYGGLIQWIAGFFALAKGETFAGSFMTAYGAFWWSYVALLVYGVPHMTAAGGADAAGIAVGIYLVMWTLTTIGFWLVSFNTNGFVLATFTEFVITLIVLDIGALGNIPIASLIGGYLVILLGLMGWYVVYAELINESAGRAVVPLFPFKNGPLMARRPTPAEPF
ncbi:MAG: acetate uptake transporter [Rhodanobacteraceae bacterium]